MVPNKNKPRGQERFLDLKGRGQMRVVEFEGPAGAPTLMLLHGLAATGPLNWSTAFLDLAEHYHVVAVDHRGHGQGVRTRRFRLKDCADDVIAAADEMGIPSFIAVGYSMGGPIAKLCWRRHPERVRGLVLCATASFFRPKDFPRLTRFVLGRGATVARLARGVALELIIKGLVKDIPHKKGRDSVRKEMSSSDAVTIIQATRAITSFSSRDWVSTIDVPTSVVITTRDKLVPTRRQYELAGSIEGSRSFEVSGDHFACANDQTNFVPALLDACAHVHSSAA